MALEGAGEAQLVGLEGFPLASANSHSIFLKFLILFFPCIFSLGIVALYKGSSSKTFNSL